MVLDRRIRDYYRDNPLMVSSPFGGVTGLNHDLIRQVFEHLKIDLQDRVVLDVGCGRGYCGDLVREAGGTYVGTDLVPSRPESKPVIADAAMLPFPDGRFDIVFCIDAFEHFPRPENAVREFRRVLAPGGFVFLSVPNYGNVAGIVKWACETSGRYAPNTWAPFRNWQPQELESPLTARRVRRLFRSEGFTRLQQMAYGPEVGLGLFPWVEHLKMPEAIKFRLQRLFAAMGPAFVRIWPGASLHHFWKIER